MSLPFSLFHSLFEYWKQLTQDRNTLLPTPYSLFPIPCLYGIFAIGSSITGVRFPSFSA